MIMGDVYYGDPNTRVAGGDDTFNLTQNLYDAVYHVHGDMRHGASIWGGDDTIVGFRSETQTSYFYGDAWKIHNSGGGWGGDDTIKATEGDNTIYGDFWHAGTAAILEGGDDTLYGYGGDDTIVGDFGTASAGASYGEDEIYGGDGNDTIYGDLQSNVNVGADDVIDGGKGEDTIYGGGGNDTIDGGEDDDWINGNAG